MREDPEHEKGGSFLVRVSRSLASYYWEKLVIALITEQFDADVIGGIISARRAHFNLFLWHCVGEDPGLRLKICGQLCGLINLPKGTRVDYTAHTSVINAGEGARQPIHYIYEEDGPTETQLPGRHKGPEQKEEAPA
jgi:translation initiation factor 4E